MREGSGTARRERARLVGAGSRWFELVGDGKSVESRGGKEGGGQSVSGTGWRDTGKDSRIGLGQVGAEAAREVGCGGEQSRRGEDRRVWSGLGRRLRVVERRRGANRRLRKVMTREVPTRPGQSVEVRGDTGITGVDCRWGAEKSWRGKGGEGKSVREGFVMRRYGSSVVVR